MDSFKMALDTNKGTRMMYNASILDANLKKKKEKDDEKVIFKYLKSLGILETHYWFSPETNNICSLPIAPTPPLIRTAGTKKKYIEKCNSFFESWLSLIEKYLPNYIVEMARHSMTTQWWEGICTDAFFNQKLNKKDKNLVDSYLAACHRARGAYISDFCTVNSEYYINDKLLKQYSKEYLTCIGIIIADKLHVVNTKIKDFTDVLLLIKDYEDTGCFSRNFTYKVSEYFKNTTDYEDGEEELRKIIVFTAEEFIKADIENKSIIMQFWVDLENC